MKPISFLTLFVTAILITISCKEEITKPVVPIEIPKEIEPGRRDYVWEEIELGENAFTRRDMWGSDLNNIWLVGQTSSSILDFWYYNGKICMPLSTLYTPAAWAIWGSSKNDIWIGSTVGTLWHFNGTSLDKEQQLKTKDGGYFTFCHIWGKSANEIYATGIADAFPGDTNTPIKGAIFKFDGKEWKQLPLPEINVSFDSMLMAKNGDMLIMAHEPAEKGFSSLLIVWDGKEFKQLAISPIWVRIYDTYLINDVLYVVKEKVIYKYVDGVLKTWKDFTSTQFANDILVARNEKDMFLFSYEGIAHYNGIDFKLLYPIPWGGYHTTINGCVFEKDIFIGINNTKTNKSKLLHGKLKE